jgi:hypothetical protein
LLLPLQLLCQLPSLLLPLLVLRLVLLLVLRLVLLQPLLRLVPLLQASAFSLRLPLLASSPSAYAS